MKVKDAISLMAKNPAVDFPWQAALCGLVNSFLPAEGQLDPCTAEAPEIQKAIDGLEASTQQMLYDSSLGSQAVAIDAHQTGKSDPRSMRFFVLFGITMSVLAALLYKGTGGSSGLDSKDIVELVRIVLQAVVTGTVPDAGS